MADTQVPIETLAVTFFEQPVLAARIVDGTIYLSMRDLCGAVGLDARSQVRRVRADEDLRDGLQRLRVTTAGGPQDQDFLILEFVPAWITGVNRNRTTVAVRERLRYLRLFSIREVYNAIARTAGLPEGSSSRIEDLQELQRYDTGMEALASRQAALETSQDRARDAWREHEQRLCALEAHLTEPSVVSVAQRGHIYQLVQVWAQARIDQEGVTSATAFVGCWSAVKTRYKVAKYEHIPARDYDDCVRYIERAYQRLTGQELRLPDADGA